MKVVALLFLALIFLPISAFMYMLFAGWLHANVIPGINPIGYVTAIKLALWTGAFAIYYGFGKGLVQVVEKA